MHIGIGGLAVLTALALNSPTIAGETVRVTINQFKYDPPKISAQVGDTIEWASQDFVAHAATAKNKD